MLNDKRCDAFQREHPYVIVCCFGREAPKWQIWYSPRSGESENNLSHFPTRQAAITAYWQKYHKDWTPPIEDWDAERAIEYMKERHLCVFCHNSGNFSIYAVSGSEYANTSTVHTKSGNFIGAVLAWKAEHDPDKPTREQTAEKLLRQILEMEDNSYSQEFIDARKFLANKEAAEGTDDGGGSDHDQ